MSKYAEMFDAEAASLDTAAPDTDAPASKYAQMFDEEVSLQREHARTILETALKDDPDIAAERLRISQMSGVPLDVVQRNLDELRIKERARSVDLIDMAQQSPVLYRQLTDPTFATTSIDDLDTLKNLERSFKRGLDYVTDTENGLAEDAAGTGRSLALGATVGVGAGIFDVAGVLNDVLGWDAGANAARDQAKAARDSMKYFGLQAESSTGQAVRSGLESAGQNLAILPLGLSRSLFQSANAAASAVAGVMSTFVGAEAYNRARELDRNMAQSAAYAIPQAGFEFVLERIPASKLFSDIAADEKFLRMLGKQALSEGWTEQVTTVLQDFNEWMNLNPDKTLAEFIAERPEAAYQTLVATMVGVGVQTSAIKTVDTLVQRATDRKLQFDQDLLEQQMQLARDSALRARSPEMFRQHIQRVVESDDAAKKEIYVDAEALNQLPQDVLNQLPEGVRTQLPEALAANSTVAIPMADVLTIAPGTPLEQFMNDNARIQPGAANRLEAQLSEELLAQEAQRIMQQAADQSAWQSSSEAVKQNILDQLNTAGRFTSDVNEAYATLQANFFSTMAARAGVTPQELFDRFQLKVTSQAAAGEGLNAGGRAVKESLTAKFAVKPPKKLYRGIAKGLQEDGSEGFGTFMLGKGVYSSPSKKFARQYGDVIEVSPDEVFPRNPLVLAVRPGASAPDTFKDWLIREQGFKSMREFNAQYPDPGDYVRSLGYDGAVIGDEVVKYPTIDRGVVAGSDPVDLGGDIFANGSRRDALNQPPAFDGPETGSTPLDPNATEIDVDGVMRPTMNSNGKPIHPTLEGVRNFWRWFGDSQVVDDQGRPLVVYHGTGAAISEFNTQGSKGKTFGTGAFFTANRSVANSYATGESRNVMPVYLRITAPVVVEAGGKFWNRLDKKVKLKTPSIVVADEDDAILAELEGRDPASGATKKLKPKNTTLGKLFPQEFEWGDETFSTDDLARWARKTGYEGVVFEDVVDRGPSGKFSDKDALTPSRNFVAFNPEQIKSAVGNTGAFDPGNANILMQSGQERDLVVTHNLTADNLLHAVKVGGLAVPSLAVTKKDSPLTGFGEITLIGSEAMADPKGYAGTKVFGADIYSPRYPNVERELDTKALAALRKEFAPLEKEFASRLPDQQDLEREGQERMERSPVVMAKFLRDQGREPEVVFLPGMAPERMARFEAFGLGPYLDRTDVYDLMEDKQFVDAAAAELIDMYEQLGEKRSRMVDKLRTDETTRDNLVRDTAREIANAAKRRKSPELDIYASQSAMEKQIEQAGLANDYQQYVADTLDKVTKSERIFQGFTNSGNRKYIPHTLENVVKILKKELRGGENFNYGVGSLRAKFTPQFKSVAEIRKNKDRLVSEAQFTKVKEEIDAEFMAVASAMSESLPLNTVVAILEDAPKLGLERAAADFEVTLSDDAKQKAVEFLNKLRKLPTAYFEAKILREVDIAEFSAAVVPDDVNSKVLEALKSRGITDIRTYDKNNEADRAAKIAEFDNLFFQNQQAARGTFNPKTNTIALMQSADLSTFLHESGHFFLEVMAELASQPNAPAGIAEDMSKTLAWFGVPDLATWNSYTLNQKRAYHERWAESFEAYLFEGKAPSVEMQPVFRRFRSWLVSVYQSLKAFMQGRNLQMNQEIREVFDRMLAADEQIRQAEEAAGLLPEEDATNTAIEQLQARSLRDLRWTINARSRELKKFEKEANALRKGVEAEVRAEVARQPIYRAMTWLKKGEMVDDATGDLIKAEKGFKLDTAALKEMYPDGMLAKPDVSRLRGMTGKESLHPDLVADMFGFQSGDALVRAVIDAEPMQSVIDGITDQRMLERHGDLSTPEAREQAANEAVHNEARARSLATELKAQQDMLNDRQDTGRTTRNGRPITVNALMNAAAMFGANVAARRAVKDLKKAAWQHRAAEARAGKAWLAATTKADTQAAVQAKRDQVLNNAAARALHDAQGEARKIIEFFKSVTKGNNEKVVKRGRDPDVVNAMRAILAAYGVTPRLGKSALEYMEAVQRNDPTMHAVLMPNVQAALVNAVPLEQLTMEQLRGLHDEMRAMWLLAKRSRQMEIDGNLLDLEDAEDELMARLQEIGIPDTVPGEVRAITDAEKRSRGLQHAGSLLRRAEQWAEGMDGKWGGPFLRLVFQPVKEAANRYRADRVKYRKAYQALVDAVAPHLRKGPIAAPEIGYTFGEGHNVIGHAELLHAILHTGNQSNKRKLLLGRKWATENADGSLDTSRWDAFLQRMHDDGILTKAHYDFAQGVWDLLEQTKPLAQKTHRDVFGRYFAEVTADEVATPFGTYRGGYVPAQADPRIVQDADLRKLAEAENENMAYSFPATNRGFTKGRVEYNRPLMLDLRTLGQHLDKVLLFSHMEPAVRDVNKLLSQKSVSHALGRIDPTIYAGMLTPWLSRSARQIVETPAVGDGGISRVLSVVRSRAGMALMFGNISNALQQLTGFSTAFAKLKTDGLNSHMTRATAQFIADPKAMNRSVAAASPFMEGRMENEIAAINDAMDAILLDASLYERGQAWVQKHAYFLQTALANTMEPIIWTAGYNAALEKDMSEPDAVRYADGLIRQTQGSTLPEDVSRIETGPAYARLFTQFIGYFNMMANTNGTGLKQIAQEMGLKKGAGKALLLVTTGMLVPLWVAEAIAQSFRGGPDDEDDDGYLDDWLVAVFGMGTIKGTFAMVPFVGQVANVAINKLNDNPADDRASLSPAVSLLEGGAGVVKLGYQAVTDPDKINARAAVRDVSSAISLATGIPAYAAARPVGYAAGVVQGKIDPTGPIDLVRGLATGTASPESKQP